MCLTIAEAATLFEFDDLRTEAAALEASAGSAVELGVSLDPVQGTLRGPRRQRHSSGGSLQRWHEGAIRAWCEELLELELFPTRCAYLYFDGGSTLGLHQDVPSCSYTAAVHLFGMPPILCVLLDDREIANRGELFHTSRAANGHPDGLGFEITLNEDRLMLFRGRRFPHRLKPFEGPCLLATFCYSALVPVDE